MEPLEWLALAGAVAIGTWIANNTSVRRTKRPPAKKPTQRKPHQR